MPRKSLTKQPEVLYRASLEHIEALDGLRDDRQWVLVIYVAGLAVECILQAIALRDGAADDGRHDLKKWLGKCPGSLQATIGNDDEVADHWYRLNITWANSIRYLPRAGLLRWLNKQQLYHGIKQGNKAGDPILKMNVNRMIQAARAVHHKGVTTWLQHCSTK